jgi:hypothetical protein
MEHQVIEQLNERGDPLSVEAASLIFNLQCREAVLMDTIAAVSQAMAGAPAWNQLHRDAIALLQEVEAKMSSE